MKKLFTVLLALVALVSLWQAPRTAQAAEAAPTDEQVLAAYQEATTVHNWFFGTSLPTNGKDKKEYGYLIYYNVDYPSIKLSVDLQRETQKVFTVEFANALIGKSLRYKDFDGWLYVCPINIAKSKRIGEATYQVERLAPDKIVLHVTTQLINPKSKDHVVVGSKTTDFSYVNTIAGWRFATFSTIR
ncbi:MAG: hypothetical protein RSE47_01450 [Acidaminococcaceae bacterium]